MRGLQSKSGACGWIIVGRTVVISGILGSLAGGLLSSPSIVQAQAGAPLSSGSAYATQATSPAQTGQAMVLQGRVIQVLGEGAYVLDNNVLVLAQGQQAPTILDQTPEALAMRATGTLRRLTPADREVLRRQYGIGLAGRTFLPWQGEWVLLAQTVEVARVPATQASEGAPRGVQRTPPGNLPIPPSPPGVDIDIQPDSQREVSPQTILDRPEQFLGRTIIAAGEVGRVLNRRAFTLETEGFVSDTPILVISIRPLPGTRAGELPLIPESSTRVLGRVFRFDLRRFEQQTGIDLDDSLAAWSGQPAILANGIDLTPDSTG